MYYQSTEPSGGTYQFGDRWYDHTDNFKLHIFNGESWEDFNG